MKQCGIVENLKGKKQPACRVELVDGKCAVHCRAKLRGERAGRFCPNRHKKGRRGCRMHGGNARVGIGSPKYKTGEYSRYVKMLSPKVAERYMQAQANPNFLSLAPDIWMVQTRIEELIERANRSNESGAAWNEARAAFDQFIDANDKKDKAGQVAALSELNRAISAGKGEYDAYTEVRILWGQLQRLVESERKRALEYGELLQVGIVLNILKTTAELVRQHVSDQEARSAISRGLGRITGGTVSSMVSSGSSEASQDLERTALVTTSKK